MLKIYLNAKQDKTEQINLFNKTFGIQFTDAQWDRKHYHNPCMGCSENVCMYENSKLIAFNMFMPQKYVVDDKEFVFLQSCESVVKEEERGKGYCSKLLTESERLLCDKYHVIFGIPNNNSAPAFKRLGYKQKTMFDMLIKPGRIKNIVEDLLFLDRKDKNNKIYCNDLSSKNIKCSLVADFENKVKHISDPSEIVIKRDDLFYQWKMGINDIYCYYIKDDDTVEAYCIVKFYMGRRIRRAEVLDVYVMKGKENMLKKIIKAISKNVSVIYIMVAAKGKNKKIFKNMGFSLYKKDIASLVYKVISRDTQLDFILSEKEWDFSPIECDTTFN